jgi:hypothetical protein
MADRRTHLVLAAETLLRDHEQRTDCDLVRDFLKTKSQDAFASLVRRHGPMVSGVCRRILGNADDADDALQATFLVLAMKVSSLASRPTLGDWLHEVARRTALNARRYGNRRRHIERQIMPQHRSANHESRSSCAIWRGSRANRPPGSSVGRRAPWRGGWRAGVNFWPAGSPNAALP